MPLLTVAIMASVYHLYWRFAAEKKLFDYRSWAIALFGLIPLIAKGYGNIGYVAIFVLIIPVLVIGFLKQSNSPQTRP